MNISTIKKPAQRIDTKYLSALNIKSYGADNLYPQIINDVVSASSTGQTCLNRYARFIEGKGVKNIDFAEYVVNRQAETVDDIIKMIAGDIARYNGFSLHVNYDIFGSIVELQHVPFEACRLEEDDDSGQISNIVTHPDWRGKRTRNGTCLKVSADTINKFPIFNSNTDVVFAQIQKAGGIELYKGQILWVSGNGKFTYPTPKYDCAITDMSTDEGLSNVKHRNTRNNFLAAGMLVTKKSQNIDDDSGDGYADVLQEFQGDEKACNFLNVEIESDEEKPQFVEFPVRNYDKDFTATDTSVVDRIYSAFDQEVFHCIKIGKLGFSGDVIRDAYAYYSSIVNSEQRMIERAFDKIFRKWYEEPNPTFDFSLQPLTMMSNEAADPT